MVRTSRAVIARKAVHVTLALGFALLAPRLGVRGTVLAAAALFVIFLAARTVRAFDPLRYAEQSSYGELFFAVGVLLSALFVFPRCPSCFMVGMLVLAIADPLASLVGRSIGRHTYCVFGEQRTLEGSGACCIATGLLALYLTPLSFQAAGLIAVVITGVEAIAPRGSDNMAIPFITGLLVSVL